MLVIDWEMEKGAAGLAWEAATPPSKREAAEG